MNIDSDHSEKVNIKKNPQENFSKCFNLKEEFKTEKKKNRFIGTRVNSWRRNGLGCFLLRTMEIFFDGSIIHLVTQKTHMSIVKS